MGTRRRTDKNGAGVFGWGGPVSAPRSSELDENRRHLRRRSRTSKIPSRRAQAGPARDLEVRLRRHKWRRWQRLSSNAKLWEADAGHDLATPAPNSGPRFPTPQRLYTLNGQKCPRARPPNVPSLSSPVAFQSTPKATLLQLTEPVGAETSRAPGEDPHATHRDLSALALFNRRWVNSSRRARVARLSREHRRRWRLCSSKSEPGATLAPNVGPLPGPPNGAGPRQS